MKGIIAGVALVTAIVGSPPIAAAQSGVHCATEGGYCNAPAGATISYGANGTFAQRVSPPGGLACNNSVFGDPIVGTTKECYYSTAPTAGSNFANPVINGVRVDHCLTWAQQCDEPAASAFCRTQGLSHATAWHWVFMAPTIVQGTGQICNDPQSCGGFDSIVCE